ncbi:MAG: GNAT family N-acetyltransferase [Ruminococcus sp.]|nr:GNAT family N-acetyltransferase [Ruminococcus sp.]
MKIEIRKALISDVDVLYKLNEDFNGKGTTQLELLKNSIINNEQEIVFIATADNKAVGFCCVQIFKSMCYSKYYLEITELYIDEKYRRLGIATKMFEYIEEYFKDKNIAGYQLFTGKTNYNAQAFYEKQGYIKSDEIMYRKRPQMKYSD